MGGFEFMAVSRELAKTQGTLEARGQKVDEKYSENGTRTSIFDDLGNYSVSFDEDGNGIDEKSLIYNAEKNTSYEQFIDNNTGEMKKLFTNKDGNRRLVFGNETIIDKIKNMLGLGDSITLTKEEANDFKNKSAEFLEKKLDDYINNKSIEIQEKEQELKKLDKTDNAPDNSMPQYKGF